MGWYDNNHWQCTNAMVMNSFIQNCSRLSKIPLPLFAKSSHSHIILPPHPYLVHPDDYTPVVRNMHLGPNTGIYIPRESGISLYTNVLALRLDVRRGCQVALVEQIHKIHSVLPCPSSTPNPLYHSLTVLDTLHTLHKVSKKFPNWQTNCTCLPPWYR